MCLAPQGDEVIVSHISQHGKNWPYWFRKMGMLIVYAYCCLLPSVKFMCNVANNVL